MRPLPLLGLVLDRRDPTALVPLLVAARRWCLPVTVDATTGEADAVLTTAGRARAIPPALPMALWTRDPADLASAPGERAAAIVSEDAAVVRLAGPRGVFAAPDADAGGRRPVPPFVRQRLRSARGLPEVALLEQAGAGWRWSGREEPLDGVLLPTAMACASAVCATRSEHVVDALGWGAPCVTDPATAGEVGAEAGRHVLTGAGEGERSAELARIVADAELAARLSWAGRRLFDERHAAPWGSERLVELLGLRRGLSPIASAELRLSELGTPPDARISDRFASFVEPVTQ